MNIYLLALKILGNDIGGRPLLILGVLLIFIGIQFFTTGIIVDMLMKTYYESQEKDLLTSEISQHLEKVNLKKLLINFAKIFISIALLYFVFQKIPFREVTVLWAKTNVFYLVISAILFLASQIISTKRLELYFKANDFHLSFRSNVELYFLGMFYNFFIPGGIGGDAYKVYLLNKNFGWSAKKITSSLFNDRLSGLLAICVLILVFSFNLLEAKFFPSYLCF